MKSVLAISLGMAFSAAAAANTLPSAPTGCDRDLAVKNFCSGYEAPVLRGPVSVKFFATVDKGAYTDVDALLARYKAFDKWPEYVLSSGRSDVIFNASAELSPIVSEERGEVLRHYANYKIDSVIGYQDVRVVTHNYAVDAYEGALASLEFEVQSSGEQEVPLGEALLNGSEGVQRQVGSVHAVDCAASDLCSDDQYLLIYQSTVTPDIDLLPSLAARAISRGVESILIGMFLIDEPVDDDIL